MPTFDGKIEDFVAGADLQITRTITNVPDAVSLTKAWFTVKEIQAHADANAIFQKEITTSNVPGTGQITDAGSGSPPDRIATVRFDFGDADTILLKGGQEYLYDVQVLTDGGAVYTPETGEIVARPGVTIDTS